MPMFRGLLAVVAAAGACLAARPAAGAVDPVRVLFTGDVRGHSAACECPATTSGSLAQRATLVRDLQHGGGAGLVVDAGNLLFPTRVAAPPREQVRRRLDALTLVDAYGLLGVAAVNVGPLDLAEGLDWLVNVGARSRFPWISANLRSDATDTHLLSPSAVVSRGGVRIGIVGVLPGGLRGAGWITTDPAAEVRRAVRPLKEAGVDRIVLLAATGSRDGATISRKAGGVDLVVAAGDRRVLAEPRRARGGWVVEAGSRGDTVGDCLLGPGKPDCRVHEVATSLAEDPAIGRLLDERRARDIPALPVGGG